MKEILINILAIIYQGVTIFILGLAILLPFTFEMSDPPIYLEWWIVYPLALIIMATQGKALTFFNKHIS